jgi:hypothetical protein
MTKAANVLNQPVKSLYLFVLNLHTKRPALNDFYHSSYRSFRQKVEFLPTKWMLNSSKKQITLQTAGCRRCEERMIHWKAVKVTSRNILGSHWNEINPATPWRMELWTAPGTGHKRDMHDQLQMLWNEVNTLNLINEKSTDVCIARFC